MKIVEFGKRNANTVMLLHGGGLNWWNYRDAAEILAEDFHVLIPVLDGHAGSGVPFSTMEDNAARLIRYIDETFGGQVTIIGGLSLGGQMAVEMLSQRPDICKFALLESALVKPMKLTHALIGPSVAMSYGLVKQRWFARWQASYLRIPRNLFEDYYRDTCKISKADMIAFLKANSSYTIKPALAQSRAKVRIVAGAREQKGILESAKRLREVISHSELEILPGLYHGDLSINQPQRYAGMLKSWMEEENEDI